MCHESLSNVYNNGRMKFYTPIKCKSFKSFKNAA